MQDYLRSQGPNLRTPKTTDAYHLAGKMSAQQVFQCAFAHVQQSRPPDGYPLELTETQWNELPPDCQALVEILNWYNLADEVGLFIYRYYPQIAVKIIPALETGLGPFESRRGLFQSQLHEDDFRTKYVINLAQTALDAPEASNNEANDPEASEKLAEATELEEDYFGEDYFGEELEGSLSVDWFSENSLAARDSSNITLRSMECEPEDKPEQANQLQSERPAEANELEEVNVKPEEPHSTIEIKRPVTHRSYPQIAAEILPALRESLNTLVQRYTIHTLPREFINHYFTRLAQTALDELQKYTIWMGGSLPKELAD